jgi:hypothetical protein
MRSSSENRRRAAKAARAPPRRRPAARRPGSGAAGTDPHSCHDGIAAVRVARTAMARRRLERPAFVFATPSSAAALGRRQVRSLYETIGAHGRSDRPRPGSVVTSQQLLGGRGPRLRASGDRQPARPLEGDQVIQGSMSDCRCPPGSFPRSPAHVWYAIGRQRPAHPLDPRVPWPRRRQDHPDLHALRPVRTRGRDGQRSVRAGGEQGGEQTERNREQPTDRNPSGYRRT